MEAKRPVLATGAPSSSIRFEDVAGLWEERPDEEALEVLAPPEASPPALGSTKHKIPFDAMSSRGRQVEEGPVGVWREGVKAESGTSQISVAPLCLSSGSIVLQMSCISTCDASNGYVDMAFRGMDRRQIEMNPPSLLVANAKDLKPVGAPSKAEDASRR